MKRHKLRKPPFAIFGLGKLGGRELIYASDLDIIFVAGNSTKSLSTLQKMAVELMDLLSSRTEEGTTFATDARLRPDGDKGLLVNSVDGYSEYYKKRAMLWEIQSLTRFRPIVGDAGLIEIFAEMAREMTNFATLQKTVSAFTPEWKSEIHRMRMRIEKERTPPGQDKLAIKTGLGGLMDVEFIAQAICLEQGWHEPNTLAAIARAGAEKVIPAKTAKLLSENYRHLMQVERILRRWSFEPESVLPTTPEPYYRVAVRCGFKESAEFERAVLSYRSAIRLEYEKIFQAEPSQRGTGKPGG